MRRFLPLAKSLALRYRRQTESLDDLVQVASLGLVKAINGFDPSLGFPFKAYATPTILGELRRHFRDHVWNLRLPRGLQELTMKIDRATDGLAEELGRYPTPTEIAERLDVTVEDVLDGIEAGHLRSTQSLDAPSSQDEGSLTLVETLGKTEAGYDRVEAEQAATRAELDEREWRVLRLRFVDQMTQREIGHQLGVSQMQISRISRRALAKLLTAVRGEQADGSTKVAAGRGRRRAPGGRGGGGVGRAARTPPGPRSGAARGPSRGQAPGIRVIRAADRLRQGRATG